MGMPVTTITAETLLPNIEGPLKVFAGPGAGKTRFLINHIKNVLHHSTRLGSCRKVACITYTNVGTETILRRLGNPGERVEVSTIHSFLYKHVIKPYIHLIPPEYDLTYLKVDGHDDIVLTSYSFIEEWKSKTGQKRITDNSFIAGAWAALRWKFDMNGDLVISTPYPHQFEGYSIKSNSYLEYKKMMWVKGLLHHDDVLFFAWVLTGKYPFLLDVLRAKFPYFFVDEFQDTNPIQVKILERIALRETVVAIIGDKAQSIYSFLGADPEQMDTFTVPRMQLYKIDDNHRSTETIVGLLNHVRKDLSQTSIRSVAGIQIEIIIGEKIKAVNQAKTTCPAEEVYCLCRDNITSNMIRKQIDGNVSSAGLLDSLYSIDSNRDRQRVIVGCVKAIEYARQGYFKDAIKELKSIPATRIKPELAAKRKALLLLKKLLDDLHTFENCSLYELYEYLNNNNIVTLAGLRAGNIRSFYTGTKFKDISAAVKNLNETGTERTIHKSKGDEFDNVIVVLDKDKDGNFDEKAELGFLLSPDLSKEEQRIRYVAISRARNKLFINVPSASAETLQFFNELNLNINVTIP
jgi:DNA helicase-2/ATP-dependent DNA helicase PcrA